MKISVIIPTYKPQNYLWECLDSLVAQTLPREDFEVILVLNGCTEPYKTAIEEYIAKKMNSMNVNYIHTEKGGVSNARNLALDNAKGDYITFIDDDDYVSPSYLEALMRIASPEKVALCHSYIFNDNDAKKKSYILTQLYNKYGPNKILPYQVVRQYFSGPCMKLIHKDIISDRRFDCRFKNGEDALYMFLISDRLKFIEFTEENAVYYRRHRENSAHFSKKKRSYIVKNEFLKICEYSKIYFFNFGKYSVRFYATRVLAAFKSLFV